MPDHVLPRSYDPKLKALFLQKLNKPMIGRKPSYAVKLIVRKPFHSLMLQEIDLALFYRG